MRKDNKYNILLHKSNLVFEWPLIGGQSSQDEGVSPSDCSSESEIEEPNFQTKQLEAEENQKKEVIKEENPYKEVIGVKRKKDSTNSPGPPPKKQKEEDNPYEYWMIT